MNPYSFDGLGQLTAISGGAGGSITYQYDGLGRRTGRVKAGSTERYVYDGAQLVGEYNGSGSLVSTFLYASRSTVPDLMIQGGAVYRIISDERGSPRVVVRVSDGVVAEKISYSAYGIKTQLVGSPGGYSRIPFGFAGGLQDADYGFVHFGAREYDPDSARWLTRDPSGLAAGTNVYAYANGDPINFVDRTGTVPRWLSDLWTGVWEGPTSTIGVAWGLAGAASTESWHWNSDLNALEIYNHPFQALTGQSVTLGRVICYANAGQDRPHEQSHLPQSAVLGPFYLPAQVLAIAVAVPTYMVGRAAGVAPSDDPMYQATHYYNPAEVGPDTGAGPWNWSEFGARERAVPWKAYP